MGENLADDQRIYNRAVLAVGGKDTVGSCSLIATEMIDEVGRGHRILDA
jgi:hypothetical protein